LVTAYLDASAMVKLIVEEPDSPAMYRWYIEHAKFVTSRIGMIETRRAANRRNHAPAYLTSFLRSISVLELDHDVAERAASAAPVGLRTLDAIHLATALAIGSELDAFVTYDDRLAEAARAIGLPVVRPA
jgi:predicted nucleic acid-binding protein